MDDRVERWDITDIPPADRFDGWREVLSETHVPWDLGSARDASPGYRARVERRQVGALRIVDCSCDPCGGTRGAREIAATHDEWAVVLFNLRGREIFDRHLSDPSLRPQLIADAHHIALRTLQLIFAERGETVSDRVRRLRLDRCWADIAQSGRPIASVALHWGFVDAAHFSRCSGNGTA